MGANLEIKKQVVEEIKENFKKAKSVVFVNFVGLTVEQDNKLRKQMRENNCVYKVYKNRLMLKALEELGISGFDTKMFEGNTAVAFGSDEVAAAKVVADNVKETEKLEIKFGIVDGEIVDKAKVEALSKIPSRETLLAMLLGTLQAPISAFARAIDAVSKK